MRGVQQAFERLLFFFSFFVSLRGSLGILLSLFL